MDAGTFRITKVIATSRCKTCATCGTKIKEGHKVAIDGDFHCDLCVVSGFLADRAVKNSGTFGSIKRLFSKPEAIELNRYVERRKPVKPVQVTLDEPMDEAA